MSRPLLAVAAALLAGCVSFGPRFEQDVATTFAQDDMRRVETELLEVYYPAEGRDAALRVAARAEECLRAFRAREVTQRPRDKALLFLTSANYNNAYVSGQYGGEPLHSLNPLSATSELFHWYGLSGADVGDIACHEMFHFAHFEQVENLWRGVNAVVGPVVSSQVFLERWFTEGAAQYYEGRIGRTVGRPHSPLYRGAFHGFVAAKGGLGGGDLSVSQRELAPFSGAYLTGLFFVEWLADTYGEDSLWRLMDLQGRAVFVPFGAALRFKAVYGHELGDLLTAFEAHLRATLPARTRPPTQQVLRPAVGQLARLAAHGPSGTLALVSSGNEEVPMLRLLEADGRVRAERRLVRLTTDRDWIAVGPGAMSGLSFTADGRWLYLVNDDLIPRGDTRSQLWKVDAQTGETVQVWQQVGRMMGGGVAPDGRSFLTVELPPGASRLVDVDLASGAQTVLWTAPAGVAISAPQWSPDRQRVVFSRLDRAGWNLVLREPDGSVRALTGDGAFNYGARWSDETHVVFARAAGSYLQVHRLDVETGALEQLTDAPWGVLDPAPAGDRVAFINRDGSQWSLDATSPSPRTTHSAPSSDAASGWYEPPALTLRDDAPASSLDHLFIPQLRAPALASLNVNPARLQASSATLTLSVGGRDRLARHTWLVSGALTAPTLEHVVQVAYENRVLAPWTLALSAGREWYPGTTTGPPETFWTGSVSAGRTVFTTPIAFGARAEVWQPASAAVGRYFGPWLSVAYSAGEATGYGGTQRRLGLSFDLAGYPRALGSDRDLLDVGAQVDLAFPLPASRRHSFVMSIAGRALPGAPNGALRVGGVGRGIGLWSSSQGAGRAGLPPGVFLPGSFVEPVRGYDDFSVRATAAGIAQARYRYLVIIDRGFTSTLYLLPSAFFRQVELEAFGAAAATDNPKATWARAAGASIALRTVFGGGFPVTLGYQFAWRFDFGLAPLHVVSLAFE